MNLSLLKPWLRARRKAAVAAVVAAAVGLAAKYGVDLTDAQTTALTAVLTTLSVYFVPND